MKTKLSIIILSFNTARLLKNCLNSIYKNKPDFNFEVIVLDNNSQDNSAEMVKKDFPGAKLIASKKNLGFGKGNNKASKYAKGEYLLFLNSDTLIKPKSLKKLVSFLDENKKAGAILPKLVCPDHTIQTYSAGYKLGLGRIFMMKITKLAALIFPKLKSKLVKFNFEFFNWRKVKEVDWISGAALMIRKKLFEKIKGFDQRFFMYFEDADLCLRTQKMGYKIFVLPSAEITHLGGKSFKTDLNRKEIYYQNQDQFIKKHFNSLSYYLFQIISFPYRFFALSDKKDIFKKIAQFGLILFIFSLPLERLPSWEVFGYTLKISYILTTLVAILFSAHLFINKKSEVQKSPLNKYLLIFLAAAVLSIINAQVLSRYFLILFSIIFVFIAYFLVINLIRDQKSLHTAIQAILISAGLVSLFGLFQYLGDMNGLGLNWTGLRVEYTHHILGFTRIQAFALEPLLLANYLLIPLSLGFALYLSGLLKSRWYWVALYSILLLVVFILTVARSGYVALFGAWFIGIVFYFKNFFSLRKFVPWLVVMVFSFLAVMGLLGDARGQFFSHNQKPIRVEEEASSVERKDSYDKGIQAFKKHPILGIGLGNFGPYYNRYSSQMPEDGWQTVNNEFIEILAETGIVGFAAFLALLTAIFIRSWQVFKKANDRYLKAILVGATSALAGILIQYNFFSTIYVIHIWVLIGLIVAIQEMILNKKLST